MGRKVSYNEENDWYVIVIDNMILADETLAIFLGLKFNDYVDIITTKYNATTRNLDGYRVYVYESLHDIKQAIEWIESLLVAKQLSR